MSNIEKQMGGSCLPTDYTAPPSEGGRYFKPTVGEHLIQVVGPVQLGWQAWRRTEEGAEVFRARYDDEDRKGKLIKLAKQNEDPNDRGIKHIWAVPVWDTEADRLKIWEIPQKSIREELESLHKNKVWGDFRLYPVTIIRQGEKLNTKYNVTPCPKQDPEEKWLEQAALIDWDAYFKSENPWEALDGDKKEAEADPLEFLGD